MVVDRWSSPSLRDPSERLDWLVYEDLSVRESLATAHAALGATDKLAARPLILFGDDADTSRSVEAITRPASRAGRVPNDIR